MPQTILRAVAMLGMVVPFTSMARSEPYQPAVGQRHPDLTLPNIRDGQPVSLSDYRGQKVLLIQFASW